MLTADPHGVPPPAIDFTWVTRLHPRNTGHNAVAHGWLQDMAGAVIAIALVGVGLALIFSLLGLASFKTGIQPFGRTHGDYLQGALVCFVAALCLGALAGAATWVLRYSGVSGWSFF